MSSSSTQPVNVVGIISKPSAHAAVALAPSLVEWLLGRGIQVRYDEPTAFYLGRSDGLPREQVPEGAQLVIVLGGDGTLLSAARAIAGRELPIFPVNLGGLGFLTAFSVQDVYPELERALRNEHRIAERRMLACHLVRDGKVIAEYEALNDVVLTKAALARMIDLETHVDSHLVCTYKADGLIICTPTGSTAYSLSAGGPIISPKSDVIVLAPICPHTLTARPIILPDSGVIKIKVESKVPIILTADGNSNIKLKSTATIEIKKAHYKIKLAKQLDSNYFRVLNQKLLWGVDVRKNKKQ